MQISFLLLFLISHIFWAANADIFDFDENNYYRPKRHLRYILQRAATMATAAGATSLIAANNFLNNGDSCNPAAIVYNYDIDHPDYIVDDRKNVGQLKAKTGAVDVQEQRHVSDAGHLQQVKPMSYFFKWAGNPNVAPNLTKLGEDPFTQENHFVPSVQDKEKMNADAANAKNPKKFDPERFEAARQKLRENPNPLIAQRGLSRAKWQEMRNSNIVNNMANNKYHGAYED